MAVRCGFEMRHNYGAGTQYFWLWFFKRSSCRRTGGLTGNIGSRLTYRRWRGTLSRHCANGSDSAFALLFFARFAQYFFMRWRHAWRSVLHPWTCGRGDCGVGMSPSTSVTPPKKRSPGSPSAALRATRELPYSSPLERMTGCYARLIPAPVPPNRSRKANAAQDAIYSVPRQNRVIAPRDDQYYPARLLALYPMGSGGLRASIPTSSRAKTPT